MTKPWKELGRYGGVGIELVLAILILAGLGHWLDQRYGHGGSWGMAIGFFLGVAVGARNLVRIAARMQRDIETAEAQDPQAGRWTVDPDWVHGSESDTGDAADPGKDDAPTRSGRKNGDDRPN
jgi:hypothetical protein